MSLRLELQPLPTLLPAASVVPAVAAPAAPKPAAAPAALELLVVAETVQGSNDRACECLPVTVPINLTVRQFKAQLLSLLHVRDYATAIVESDNEEDEDGKKAAAAPATHRPVEVSDFVLCRYGAQ